MNAPTAQPAFRTRKQSVGGNHFIGLVYGDFGIGKTYLAGTIDRHVQKLDPMEMAPIATKLQPKGIKPVFRTLYANAEQGEDGLPMDCETIIIKDLYTYKEFGDLYEFLRLHTRAYQAGDVETLIKLQNKYLGTPLDHPELFIFKALVVDSITEIQKYCLYQLIGLSLDSNLADVPDYMQMRDWGTALEMILLMIRSFRALPMTKIFISQQQEDTDEKKKLFYRPALQGQAKSSILGFFDFCGYYAMNIDATSGSVLRRLFLLPAGPFKAKHRFENFQGVYIDNPTMEDIVKFRVSAVPIAGGQPVQKKK